jgi:hypothetical protein
MSFIVVSIRSRTERVRIGFFSCSFPLESRELLVEEEEKRNQSNRIGRITVELSIDHCLLFEPLISFVNFTRCASFNGRRCS